MGATEPAIMLMPMGTEMAIPIRNVEPRGPIARVLHTGGEGLGKRRSDQGDKTGVDVDLHEMDPPSVSFFPIE